MAGSDEVLLDVELGSGVVGFGIHTPTLAGMVNWVLKVFGLVLKVFGIVVTMVFGIMPVTGFDDDPLLETLLPVDDPLLDIELTLPVLLVDEEVLLVCWTRKEVALLTRGELVVASTISKEPNPIRRRAPKAMPRRALFLKVIIVHFKLLKLEGYTGWYGVARDVC